MKHYNYYEAVKTDLEQYLTDNIDYLFFDATDADDLHDELYDVAFNADSVTGNASGSYTFNRAEAHEYVYANHDLLIEALEEFCVPAEEIAKRLLDSDFEYFDVTIRCYVLSTAISELLEENATELNEYLRSREA